MTDQNTVVLWTGGKDCALALHKAHKMGLNIRKLVTFAPTGAQFEAHSLELMRLQAEALELPHEVIAVSEPYKASYQKAMRVLQERDGIEVFVTGDIDEVDGYPNWIRECAEPLGLEVYTPLWKLDRLRLLNEYVDAGLQVMISCVKHPWFTPDWLGRVINAEVICELRAKQVETGLDLCGEKGEYHTMVLDGPLFSASIKLYGVETQTEGSVMYLRIAKMDLISDHQ